MEEEKLHTLIRQSAEGDEKAFEELLEIIIPILYRDLARYIQNKHDRDDILQDSIWKIWSSIDKIDIYGEPIAYFRKVTYNTMISFLRRKKRKEISIPPEDFAKIPLTTNSEDSPLEEFNKDMLNHLLEQLPPRYKEAITLRYIENKSYDEIARALNTTPTTARKIVSRAIKKLKKLAGDNHG